MCFLTAYYGNYEGGRSMDDVIGLLLIAGLFTGAWGLVIFCDRLK
jgi:hypothetical protein